VRRLPFSAHARRRAGNHRYRRSAPAKFVVKKGTTGKFRFNLLSTNGKAIATSET
jgi:hypothetical protein